MDMVKRSNPYIGPRTFEQKDSGFFFGREREAKALLTLVASQRLVLFYAQSGAGKSSLINTRLIPGLRGRGFVVWPIGRVSGEMLPNLSVNNLFVFNLLLKLDEGRHAVATFSTTSLAEYILDRPSATSKGEDETATRGRILIIDQFEEILTGHRERWQDREGFFQQLEEAMQADPLLWVVLTLREDYVAPLDMYAPLMTNRLRTRFYMQRLDNAAALEAVTRPADNAGRPFAPGVAQRLVNNLRQLSHIERQEPSKNPSLGEFVEPVQLQVVCQRLWMNLQDRPSNNITAEDVAELGDVNTALADFYEQAIRQTERETGVHQYQLRTWVDKELITEGGTRGTVDRGTVASGGLPNIAVESLARQFLLSQEPRAGGIWYELIHDRFIEPIRQANAQWRLKQGSLFQLAENWNRNGRPRNKLLSGEQLQQALDEVKRGAIEPIVREFLQDSQREQRIYLDRQKISTERKRAEQERAIAEHERKNAEEKDRLYRRLRLRSIALVVMLVISVVLATIAFGASLNANSRANYAATSKAQTEALNKEIQIGELVAQTELAVSRDPELALLLALSVAGDINQSSSILPESQRALYQALLSPYVGTIDGNGATFNSIQFDATGNYLLTASSDATAQLWDINSFQQTVVFRGHSARVNSAIFSPDGHTVVTVSNDNTGRIWNAHTGELIHVLRGHTSEVTSIQINHAGTQVLTTDKEGDTRLWEIASGQMLLTYPDLYGPVFNPDDSLIFGYANFGNIKIDDFRPNQEPVDVLRTPGLAILSAVFRSDIKKILVTGTSVQEVSEDLFAVIRDLETTPPRQVNLIGHTASVSSGLFDSAGKHVFTFSDDGTVRLWDAETGEQLKVFTHGSKVTSVKLIEEESILVTTGADGAIRLWNFETGELLRTLLGHKAPIIDAFFNPVSMLLVTTGEDNVIKFWDLQIGRPQRVFEFGNTDFSSVALSSDGSLLALGDTNGTVQLWDVEHDALLQTYDGHGNRISNLLFSNDSKHLMSLSNNGIVHLWDIEAKRLLFTVVYSSRSRNIQLWVGDQERLLVSSIDIGQVNSMAFSPEGNFFVTTGKDRAHVWNQFTGELIYTSGSHVSEITTVSFSPNGKIIATGTIDGRISLWNIEESILEKTFRGHQAEITSISFSPNGQKLASASNDGTARVWQMNSGEFVSLAGHDGSVGSTSFTFDGNRLLTIGEDKSVRVWDTNTGLHLATLISRNEPISLVSFSVSSSLFAINGTGQIQIWSTYATFEDMLADARKRVHRVFTLEECKTYFHDLPNACQLFP